MKPLQTYQAPGITVTFDANRCIHSAVCLKTLPAVFDIHRSPWVQPDAATVEAIVAAIDQCPSGALAYTLAGQADASPANSDLTPQTTIRLLLNGPLMVEGTFTLVDESGMMLPERSSVALCRCGASGNAPFCDGTHLKIDFRPKKTN